MWVIELARHSWSPLPLRNVLLLVAASSLLVAPSCFLLPRTRETCTRKDWPTLWRQVTVALALLYLLLYLGSRVGGRLNIQYLARQVTWKYALNDWIWTYWHCDQYIDVTVSPCLSSRWTSQGCIACHGLFTTEAQLLTCDWPNLSWNWYDNF